MISANPNASTMMITDKASDLIRGRAAPEAAVVGSIGSGRRYGASALSRIGAPWLTLATMISN
jgi:hypothetical protein